MTTFRILSLTIAAVAFFAITAGCSAAEKSSDAQKAVLVTGASTGIGRAIAEKLASDGYFVYAGARSKEDLKELSGIENMKGIRLDVTSQDDIDAAVTTITEAGRGLFGIVNNAGVFIGGPLIEVDVDELAWLFDVNVLGVYRINHAFAPLIIQSKGRITTTGSISGTLSGRFYGQYSMSKHAIEAYTDSLAREMAKFEVKVSVIEPGNYASEIGATAKKRIMDKDYAQPGSRYAEELAEWLEGDWDGKDSKDPAEVADAALHFFASDKPFRRYMVVPNEEEAGWTIDKAIEEVTQLNQYQAYSYTREQLIEKLDAALAAREAEK